MPLTKETVLCILVLSSLSLSGVVRNRETVEQCGVQDRIEGSWQEPARGTVTYDSITTDISSDNSKLNATTGLYTAMTSGLYQATWTADTISSGVSSTSLDVVHDGISISEPGKINVSIWWNIYLIGRA